MDHKEIAVKEKYIAVVNNRETTVLVIKKIQGGDSKPTFVVRNLATGRTTSIYGGGRFLRAVNPPSSGASSGRPLEPAVTARRGRRANYTARPLLDASEGLTGPQNGPRPAKPSGRGSQAASGGSAGRSSGGKPSGGGRGLAQRLRATKAKEERGPTAPHLIVQALAGTGKTTTIVEGIRVLKGHESPFQPSSQQQEIWKHIALNHKDVETVCLVAFNKSIAKELRARVKGMDNVKAMTMHSMGANVVKKRFNLLPGEDAINGNKVRILISEYMKTPLPAIDPTVVTAIKDLVDRCKMHLMEGTWDELEMLSSHYDIELDRYQELVYTAVPQILDRCKNSLVFDRYIDFNDMIWLPVVLGLPLPRYDLLLVDESQDLNRCQQELALRAGRRLIFVGDSHQAIYGFAGADSRSIQRMTKKLSKTSIGCDTLPLTISRRCSQAVAREARKIVPEFQAHESNPEGAVLKARFSGPETEGDEERPPHYRTLIKSGDMAICRTNAPLVQECYAFLKEGRKAQVAGRNIGQKLISLINRMKASTIEDLVSSTDIWYRNEVRKENAKKFPSETRLILLHDRHECLSMFYEDARSVDEVIDKIDKVFTNDETEGILLSSIHKAKGLESENVFFLMPEHAPCPHFMAKTEKAKEQEFNLKYVGFTRAINTLYIVS